MHDEAGASSREKAGALGRGELLYHRYHQGFSPSLKL